MVAAVHTLCTQSCRQGSFKRKEEEVRLGRS
jgi:hypothetical protein